MSVGPAREALPSGTPVSTISWLNRDGDYVEDDRRRRQKEKTK